MDEYETQKIAIFFYKLMSQFLIYKLQVVFNLNKLIKYSIPNLLR